jgi:hypothetical protein
MTGRLAQHPPDRRWPNCWQLSLDGGTTLLAGAMAGAGLELTVTRPMKKAALTRTSSAAVTRMIRRARPVVWKRAGTEVEERVMLLPFLVRVPVRVLARMALPDCFSAVPSSSVVSMGRSGRKSVSDDLRIAPPRSPGVS